MKDTAKGMIENMLDMVDQFGFVPNGSRSYYLNRSQPPLLSEMVVAYYEVTKDVEFISRAIASLEKEYEFFMSQTVHGGHAVQLTDSEGNIYTLNRYFFQFLK